MPRRTHLEGGRRQGRSSELSSPYGSRAASVVVDELAGTVPERMPAFSWPSEGAQPGDYISFSSDGTTHRVVDLNERSYVTGLVAAEDLRESGASSPQLRAAEEEIREMVGQHASRMQAEVERQMLYGDRAIEERQQISEMVRHGIISPNEAASRELLQESQGIGPCEEGLSLPRLAGVVEASRELVSHVQPSFRVLVPGLVGDPPAPLTAVSDVDGVPRVGISADMIADGNLTATRINSVDSLSVRSLPEDFAHGGFVTARHIAPARMPESASLDFHSRAIFGADLASREEDQSVSRMLIDATVTAVQTEVSRWGSPLHRVTVESHQVGPLNPGDAVQIEVVRRGTFRRFVAQERPTEIDSITIGSAVSVAHDGTVTFLDGCEPSEAARLFWDAVTVEGARRAVRTDIEAAIASVEAEDALKEARQYVFEACARATRFTKAKRLVQRIDDLLARIRASRTTRGTNSQGSVGTHGPVVVPRGSSPGQAARRSVS